MYICIPIIPETALLLEDLNSGVRPELENDVPAHFIYKGNDGYSEIIPTSTLNDLVGVDPMYKNVMVLTMV